MSKHPIPDWLRSQFSRIEDDVRKLGPCGVFTQMRTVTQTYFEQQVAAPQTPALGGDLIISGPSDSMCWTQDHTPKDQRKQVVLIEYADFLRLQEPPCKNTDLVYQTRWNGACGVGEWKSVSWETYQRSDGALFDRRIISAHLAPLQAELSRMNTMFDELATAVGFSKERCEQAGDSPLDCAKQLQAEIERLKAWGKANGDLAQTAMDKAFSANHERDQLKARCDAMEALLRDIRKSCELSRRRDAQIDAALSKPAGSERVCHLCRGEGRVGGPAPDEGGGKNCGLCDGTGMEVQS